MMAMASGMGFGPGVIGHNVERFSSVSSSVARAQHWPALQPRATVPPRLLWPEDHCAIHLMMAAWLVTGTTDNTRAPLGLSDSSMSFGFEYSPVRFVSASTRATRSLTDALSSASPSYKWAGGDTSARGLRGDKLIYRPCDEWRASEVGDTLLAERPCNCQPPTRQRQHGNSPC